MVTAQKRQLLASLNKKNFRILWVGVVSKENYSGGVFGDWASRSLHSLLTYETHLFKTI
jgi:hypothetical protein